MKRLIVMRHATATSLVGGTDFERALTPEGHLEAERVGAWLAARQHLPRLALCSSATRVRETWAAVARGLGASPEVRWDRVLYEADAEDLMQEASETPDEAECVIVIGHNPSVTRFAFDLSSRCDPEGRERLRAGFRPATVAVFELPGEHFADLPSSGARLVDFVEADSIAGRR